MHALCARAVQKLRVYHNVRNQLELKLNFFMMLKISKIGVLPVGVAGH